MSIVEKATQWMEERANNDYYGYSWGGWGPQDFDCGHAIITAWETAGVPVKSSGAVNTETMYDVFIRLGFVDVTSSCNLATGEGMIRGDVLLNRAYHTAQITEPGKLVHARSSEGNSTPGDQNGNEFKVQDYFNYPWDCVLRYPEETAAEEEVEEEKPSLLDRIKEALTGRKKETAETESAAKPITTVKYMPGTFPLLTIALQDECREDVKAFQSLYNLRFASNPIKVDGYYGPKCNEACRAVQKAYGLLVDGECGKDTWTALINGKN